VPPSGLSYSSPQTYYLGTAIQTLMPTVTGTVTSYSVSPALPAGLTLSATTGAISGTPTARGAGTTFTVTASNAGGQTTFGVVITVYAGTADLLSDRVSRTVVAGTSVSAVIQAKPNFAVPGTLYAMVASSTDSAFAGPVTVTAGTAGTYRLELTTATTAAAGTHVGMATVMLCEEATCQSAALLAPVAVPFSLTVITPTSAWPGDHLTPLSPWDGVPDWTMFQGNAAHTGYVPVTLNPDRFTTRWQRAATEAYEFVSGTSYKMFNSVVTSGGQLFTAEGKFLLASSEHDGTIIWQHDFSDLAYPSTNPPAVADGTVYIAAGQQGSTYFFAFDATTGAMRFQSRMSSQWEHYLAPAVGADGVYTEGGTYGGLYGYDTSGNQLFISQADQYEVWTPAVDSAGVYSYTDGLLRVADPVTGVLLQTITDPTYTWAGWENGGSPVLGAPGRVYVANYHLTHITSPVTDDPLLAFDVPSGSIAWQAAGAYPTTPAYRPGALYAANNRPLGLEARAEASGTLAWSWVPPQAGDTGFSSEVVVTDNLAFVCTKLALYAIDIDTHKTVWSYPIVGRLALSARGVLYVAGQSTLTAINVK
jgi:hypothetical protein